MHYIVERVYGLQTYTCVRPLSVNILVGWYHGIFIQITYIEDKCSRRSCELSTSRTLI